MWISVTEPFNCEESVLKGLCVHPFIPAFPSLLMTRIIVESVKYVFVFTHKVLLEFSNKRQSFADIWVEDFRNSDLF